MDKKTLRILQLSTVDFGGGAEKIAWNLFTKYRQRGFDSWLAVGEKRSNDLNALVLPNQELRGRWYKYFRGLASRCQKHVDGYTQESLISRLAGGLAEPRRRLEFHLGIEDFNYPGATRLLTLIGDKVDILHAHNLHGSYFDLRLLPRINQQVPILMTLHDAWLLSGHCAHSFDCERWRNGCGECPDLTIYPAISRDATHYNWKRKKDIYARCQLYLATPSKWLMNKVEASMLVPAIIESRVIPNGIDLSIFHPADKRDVRDKLGIPPDTHVLLATGARIQNNTWKDYQSMHQAIVNLAECLPGYEILLIILGPESPEEHIKQAEIRSIPYQEDPQTVAQYYQAADVYIHAARADTFPTSILEALACGTPIVATALGGISEQINDTVDSFLISAGDAEGMAHRIKQLILDSTLRRSMGMLASERAKQNFSLDRQVDAYLEWYEEIIERSK